ncbi:phosphatidylethanolamine-binding protein [Multifurca ochricompacta]|uniref:Phosphatidylethanolamine-binding protein n=1 Tax=Multifurca ochricompacta TaxID=376703 RepID=A0AAD4QPI4_9AGAM|nr:phosphatidylethanolamine-binding protein [Multifurca ochricompacta]
MFLLSTTLALYYLGSLVNAQSSNENAISIAAIEAHFTGAGLVPSLLSSFDPSALITVTFPGVGAISPGQSLTKDRGTDPRNLLVPANSSVTLQGNYTLVMADADVVGADESVGQTRHWLVNGVTLTGSSPLNVSTTGGVAVTEYAGPAPPAGSGAHRYVILLLPQPSSFSPPANLSQPNVGVSVFHLTDYISTSHLGVPVAGMYFDVEQGTATATPSPTSPVVSSTLKPAASGSSSASSSASSSKSSSSNAAIRSGHSVLAIPVAVFSLLASYICL